MTYSYQYARRHGYATILSNPFKYRYVKDVEGKFRRDTAGELNIDTWLDWDYKIWRSERSVYTVPTINIEPVRRRRRIPRTPPPGTVIPIWQR